MDWGSGRTMIQFAAEASEEPFVRISRALISVGYSLSHILVSIFLLFFSSLFKSLFNCLVGM